MYNLKYMPKSVLLFFTVFEINIAGAMKGLSLQVSQEEEDLGGRPSK